MEVAIKKAPNSNEDWGLLETYEVYCYKGKGYIKIVNGICNSPSGFKFTQPYILRGGNFLPLDIIDKEMGIDKYIKSKKPFYSLASDGLIVNLKVGCDFETGGFLPEKSILRLYRPMMRVSHPMCQGYYAGQESATDERVVAPVINESGNLVTSEILNLTQEGRDVLAMLAADVAKTKGNREKFLRSRCANATLDPDEVLDI